MFLASDCTHLLFVDADIDFSPDDVFSLIRVMDGHPQCGVLGGAYPRRMINWRNVARAVEMGLAKDNPADLERFSGDFALHFLNADQSFKMTDLVELSRLGTAMMLIRREVLEGMRTATPELVFRPDPAERQAHGVGDLEPAFFCPLVDPETQALLSDDYAFCQRVRDAGFRIWLAPWIRTTHAGPTVFVGNLADTARLFPQNQNLLRSSLCVISLSHPMIAPRCSPPSAHRRSTTCSSMFLPRHALMARSPALPNQASELAVERHMAALSRRNRAAGDGPFFLGAGAYRHHVPASVDHLIQRGEFLTAYTPYQPEIAQGTLQMLFEFQSQVARLLGTDVANASMYDGSTACWEAIVMARRITRRAKALLSTGLHPHYRSVARTMAKYTGDILVDGDPSLEAGSDWAALADGIDKDTSCVVVQYPDILGRIDDMTKLAEACQAAGALLIAVVTEPVALGLIKSPGEMGADIVVGEGQSLGVGLQFGGPYVGLFACKTKYVRQMPGRLCGETVDANGKRGFVLTLSTREQHIRREKATSNICTNSGLCALAFSIHMTLLGEAGLRQLARDQPRPRKGGSGRTGEGSRRVGAERQLLQRIHAPAPDRRAAGDPQAGREGHSRRRLARPSLSRQRRPRKRPRRRRDRNRDRGGYRRLRCCPEGGAGMTALNRAGWRPEMNVAGGADDNVTFTGNRALMLEEPLIFEIGGTETTGVDFDEVAPATDIGGLARTAPIGLPGLSESETVRHYTRLSRQNYAIDLGLFPLGSCTMKHNPRLNEKVARMPGFADTHPLQPQETVAGRAMR